RFTRIVESLLPERGSPLTRCLDPSALALPIAAVEAVRRTIARALEALCGSVDATLGSGRSGSEKNVVTPSEAADALRQAQTFMSDVSGPPESEDEQRQLTSTLHALDHASRLAETAREANDFGAAGTQAGDARAIQLCAEAMRLAATIAREVATLPD